MVKEQLSPWAISAGLDLTRRLRRAPFDLMASFWLYSSETNDWRLVLASPLVRSEGILQSYERIRQILLDSGEQVDGWAHHHIDLVLPDTPLIRAIQSLGKFEIPELPPGPAPRVADPKRLKFANVDGIFMEDAYIYFVA